MFSYSVMQNFIVPPPQVGFLTLGWNQVLTTCGAGELPLQQHLNGPTVRGAVHVMWDAAMSIQAALVAQDYVGPLLEKNQCFRSDFLMLLHCTRFSLQISSHLMLPSGNQTWQVQWNISRFYMTFPAKHGGDDVI